MDKSNKANVAQVTSDNADEQVHESDDAATLLRKENRKQARRAERQAEKKKPKSKKPQTTKPAVIEVRPHAEPAHAKSRHWGLVLYFVCIVLLPSAIAGWYLSTRAADQYHSTVGFSVRKEDIGAAVEILGGITDLSNSSGSDTDILFEFMKSQQLVEKVNARVDLREIYSKPENDPIFTISPEGPIEELVSYWQRMVKVYYDGGTGLIEIRVLAFTPDDAQDIARAVFDESSELINSLSAISRADATRYATEELERAVERLKLAREAITEFRLRTLIVDPNADVQSQMGLLGNLQEQLAEALIELDLLRETTRAGDPRLTQAQRRIDVIESQIENERRKFGTGGQGPGGEDYASIFAEFERLTVNREFAEESYHASLTNYDAALAEAQRQSRYLAAYVEPTLAQSSQYPKRLLFVALVALFLTMAWAIMALVYYSIRDRR